MSVIFLSFILKDIISSIAKAGLSYFQRLLDVAKQFISLYSRIASLFSTTSQKLIALISKYASQHISRFTEHASIAQAALPDLVSTDLTSDVIRDLTSITSQAVAARLGVLALRARIARMRSRTIIKIIYVKAPSPAKKGGGGAEGGC